MNIKYVFYKGHINNQQVPIIKFSYKFTQQSYI